MTGDLNLSLPKELIPKGNDKSQNIFYNILMLIIVAIIVYVLYELYKGYNTVKKLPDTIANTANAISETAGKVVSTDLKLIDWLKGDYTAAPNYFAGVTVSLPTILQNQTPQQYVDSLRTTLKPGEGGIFTPEQQIAFDAAGGDATGDMQFQAYLQTKPEPSIIDTISGGISSGYDTINSGISSGYDTVKSWFQW